MINWRRWLPVALALLFGVGLNILGDRYYIQLQKDAMAADQDVQQELDRTLKTLQDQAALMKQVNSELDSLRADYMQYRELIPERRQIPDLLQQLEVVAHRFDVSILATQTGNMEKMSGIEAWNLNMEMHLSGRYERLLDFMQGLADLPRLVHVNSITLEPSGSSRSRVDLLVNLVFYVADFKAEDWQ